jgi:hypothetical protein
MGNGQCVEVRLASSTTGVELRDSKDPSGPVLSFERGHWRAFIDDVASGRFDEVS